MKQAVEHQYVSESIPWGYDITAIDDFARMIFKSPEGLRPDRCGEFLELIHKLVQAEHFVPREAEVLNRLYLPGVTYAQAAEAVGREGRYAMEVHTKALELLAAAMQERAEWAEIGSREYWLVTGERAADILY